MIIIKVNSFPTRFTLVTKFRSFPVVLHAFTVRMGKLFLYVCHQAQTIVPSCIAGNNCQSDHQSLKIRADEVKQSNKNTYIIVTGGQ